MGEGLALDVLDGAGLLGARWPDQGEKNKSGWRCIAKKPAPVAKEILIGLVTDNGHGKVEGILLLVMRVGQNVVD
ncbi:MAG TPA: hypothetical protein VMF32_04970 [Xanthobacteraceae bacterium]|nr:hypothetical protein [Xanthobacteraceae bacterium]